MRCTPGEWVAKPRAIGGYTIFATDDILEDVIVGFANLNDQTLEEARDNARLMAASKKMLAALKGLVGEGDVGQLFSVRMKAAHEAIAAAESTP